MGVNIFTPLFMIVCSCTYSVNIYGTPATCQLVHGALKTQDTGKRTEPSGSRKPGTSLSSDTLRLWASQLNLLSHTDLLVKNRSVEVG